MYIHIVSPDDVETQNDLFHALCRTEHSLVALIQDQVDGLVKTFQCALLKKKSSIIKEKIKLNLKIVFINNNISTCTLLHSTEY